MVSLIANTYTHVHVCTCVLVHNALCMRQGSPFSQTQPPDKDIVTYHTNYVCSTASVQWCTCICMCFNTKTNMPINTAILMKMPYSKIFCENRILLSKHPFIIAVLMLDMHEYNILPQ